MIYKILFLGPGVYFGALDFSRSDIKTENITTNTRLLLLSMNNLNNARYIFIVHLLFLYYLRMHAHSLIHVFNISLMTSTREKTL